MNARKGKQLDAGWGMIMFVMFVSIPICIAVSYDFTILQRLIDTYCDDILIW
jgi:hypothetical protein